MRTQEEVVDEYLRVKDIVRLGAERRLKPEEIDLSLDEWIADKEKLVSWSEVHKKWKSETPASIAYDTGVMLGRLEALSWVLGGD